MKKRQLLRLLVALIAAIFVHSVIVKAGPLGAMPAWCTPGTPSFISTHCAGVNLTLTDGGGNFQARWAGQYHVTTAGGHWLAYCLRDDLGHPQDSSDGVVSSLVDQGGSPVSLPDEYAYVLWKWGDTNDDNTAAAVWMLGHYYAQDTTGSGNVLISGLAATTDPTVNLLAASMHAEAQANKGPWTVAVSAVAPANWTGTSTSGSLHVAGAGGGNIAGASVSLSAIGGSVSPATVTTDASGNANFTFSSSGGQVTVSASTVGPGYPTILDPPGLADQLVGTAGSTQSFTGSASASPTKYAVGDYVWVDANKNGAQDSGELALSGVSVDLRDNAGAVLHTTTTDAQGHYVFDNLDPGTYSVRFYNLPSTYVIATQDASSIAPANNSNPNPSDGITATFVLGAANTNMRSPIPSDGVTIATSIDPTIDAGVHLRSMDLTISKKLDTAGPYKVGSSLIYELIGTNNGPDAADAGWSITDVLPAGLTFDGTDPATGSDGGFTCGAVTVLSNGTSLTCTSSSVLANGASKKLLLKVKVASNASVGGSLRNVAYIAPASGDVPETNLLVAPDFSTSDTSATSTNNDAEAVITISPGTPNTGAGRLLKASVIMPLLAITSGSVLLLGQKFSLCR